MSMDIYTNGSISIDGRDTRLGVTQRQAGTVLYKRELINGQRYEEIALPLARYALSHPNPSSGNPGRLDFEAFVRAWLEKNGWPA